MKSDDFLNAHIFQVDVEAQTNASLRDSLTSLVCELRTALRAAIPNSTVSFDLAIEPEYPAIARGYDFPALSHCLDTIVPMAYDMVDGGKAANSPLPAVLGGIEEYRNLSIPLSKLNVALPWYGYDIVCDSLAPSELCTPPVAFPNRQIGLGQILDLHRSSGNPTIVLHEDSVCKSFDYIEHNSSSGAVMWRRRVTYDDNETLHRKYSAVLAQGVGGVGIWTADASHRYRPSDTRVLAASMWESVRRATHPR